MAGKIEKKYCPSCKKDVCKSSFYKRWKGEEKLGSECRKCHNARRRKCTPEQREKRRLDSKAHYWANRELYLARNKEYRKRSPDEILNRHLKRAYGITLEDFNKISDGQGGVCAICGDPPSGRRLCVDHDHRTGAVRGLLCDPCNQGIGHLRDRADVVMRAAEYLAAGGSGVIQWHSNDSSPPSTSTEISGTTQRSTACCGSIESSSPTSE